MTLTQITPQNDTEMKKEEPCDYIAYTDGSANNLSPYGEGGSAYIIIKEGRIIHSA